MAVCACSSLARLNTQTVKTQKVDNFLGMTSKNGSNGFWPDPQVTDVGVRQNADLASVAATAVAALTTAAAMTIARKQYNIAKSWYRMARNKWDQFKKIYKPCEENEVIEACSTNPYNKQYDKTSKSYMGNAREAMYLASRNFVKFAEQYCICPDPTWDKQITLAGNTIAVDSGNWALRYEEQRKLARDDVRWDRRSQSLNRGRNIRASAASYARSAADVYGGLGDSLGRVAEGAAGFLGYVSNRNNTVYPTRSPLVSSGGLSSESGLYQSDISGSKWNKSAFFGTDDATTRILDGYSSPAVTYDTNASITSIIGSQTPSSTGV